MGGAVPAKRPPKTGSIRNWIESLTARSRNSSIRMMKSDVFAMEVDARGDFSEA